MGPLLVLPLGQNKPVSDVNEEVLHTPQIFRTGASSSDAVLSFRRFSPLCRGYT